MHNREVQYTLTVGPGRGRRIPIGKIIAKAQQPLAQTDRRTEGLPVVMGVSRGPDEVTESETAALEAGVEAGQQKTVGPAAAARRDADRGGIRLPRRSTQRRRSTASHGGALRPAHADDLRLDRGSPT